MKAGKVAVFGVPSAAGALGPGQEQAPFALRAAGLLPRLKAAGATVVNLSDLSLFQYHDDPEHPRTRNEGLVACSLETAADEMTRALRDGFTVLLGGGCTLGAAASSGAMLASGAPVGLVWIDADADINTPGTTPSGCFDGMALALALGLAEGEAQHALGGRHVAPEHVALLGYRALDPGEQEPVRRLGLALDAREVRQIGAAEAASRALAAIGVPLVVHLDADVLDDDVLPRRPGTAEGDGLSAADVSAMLGVLLGSPRALALVVCGYDPTRDSAGAAGALLVDLLADAVGARVKAATSA